MTTTSLSPAITIGILTHNYGRYIREAIDSVLTQTRTDWELIICDDASTDDTSEIVKPYLDDPRIRYHRHEKNLGQGGNWGFALEQGTAPIVAVLHADDQYLPETLATVLPLFEADPELDLVYGNWWRSVEGKDGMTIGKHEKAHRFSGHEEFEYQVRRNTCLSSAAFATRRVAQSAGLPRTDMKMVVDQEFFLRCAFHARFVRVVPEPLTIYKIHQSSTTAECAANGVTREERARLADLFVERVRRYPRLRRSIRAMRRIHAESVFSEGVTALVEGSLRQGRMLMWHGCKLGPAIALNPKRIIDLALCACGAPGYAAFRRLHRSRLGEEN